MSNDALVVAKKIAANPHGYTENSVLVVKAFIEQAEAYEQKKPDYSVTQLQRLKALMSELGLATDESLEAFCLDADRQLSRAITAMEKTLKRLLAAQSVPVVREYCCCGECTSFLEATPFEKVPEVVRLRKIEATLPKIKAMLLQEREWRLENSECGGCEVMESLDNLSAEFDAAIAGEGEKK